MDYIKTGIIVIVGLLLSISSFAAETCVSSRADFEKVKSEFPDAFQSMPVMLTTDGSIVTAAVNIVFVGNKIKLSSSIWQPGKIKYDEGYAKKVCYDGSSNFKVTLENGKTHTVEVSGKSLSIKGFSFTKSSPAKFQSIIQKIKGAEDSGTTAEHGSTK